MNKATTPKLKKDFATTLYFMKKTHSISKTYLPMMVMSAVIKACIPFINIIIPKFIIDELVNQKRTEVFVGLVLSIMIGNLILNLVNKWFDTVLDIKNKEIINGFNLHIGKKIMDMDFEKIEDPVVLDLKEKAMYGITNQRVLERMIGGIIKLFTNIIMMIGLVGIIAILDLYIVLFMILVVLVNFVLYKKAQELKLKIYDTVIPLNRCIQYFNGLIYDFSTGKDIRLYDISPLIMERFENKHAELGKEYKAKYKKIYRYYSVNKVNVQLQMAFIYSYITYKVYKKQILLGSFAMYVSAAIKFSTTLSEFSSSWIELRQMCKLLESYIEFGEIKSKIKKGSKKIANGSGFNLEFKNVSFKYPRSDEYTLKNLNIEIRDKEKLAVVGLNGAGKTTFIKLITRLYEPTDGEILLNGVNINQYDYVEYSKLLGAVFQDFKLFAFSVKENIMLTDYLSQQDSAVEGIIEQIGLEQAISKLPKGLDTHIYKIFNEDGVEFSGGQSQKLAIARAIYKNSPIMILDEPTAALDPIAEFEVYNMFNDLVEDKTAIYISHRLSSCKLCDKIAVFHKGEIVQYGGHADLINQQGSQYENMYMAQSRYYV